MRSETQVNGTAKRSKDSLGRSTKTLDFDVRFARLSGLSHHSTQPFVSSTLGTHGQVSPGHSSPFENGICGILSLLVEVFDCFALKQITEQLSLDDG